MNRKDFKFQIQLAKRLLEKNPASVIVIDKTGKIMWVNQSFRKYTSKPPQSMIGRNLLDSREMQDRVLASKYRQVLKHRKPFYRHVLKHYAELQQKWYTMLLTVTPLYNNRGHVLGAISFAQDISEIVEMEDQLRKTNSILNKRLDAYSQELKEKNKQVEKTLLDRSQFFADASHELRTPLTILQGSMDMLKMKGSSPEVVAEFVPSMQEELTRMRELLSDISFFNSADISRPNSILKKVELSKIIKNEIKQLIPLAAERGIKISGKIQSAKIIGEEPMLQKLVRNLISNAVRYSKDGGVVNVRLRKLKQNITLQVQDFGIGISQEDLPYIFDRFYRADKARSRATGGSGLGLSICKEVVDFHGGSIRVQSVLDKGSVFTVKLPINIKK